MCTVTDFLLSVNSVYFSQYLIGSHGVDCSYDKYNRLCALWPEAYIRKIAPMASTNIAFYIYYLLIISPGNHVYVYYMGFAKLLQENYLKNLFRTFHMGTLGAKTSQ